MSVEIDRPQKSSGVIPSLDGIRALAVGLVFIAHSGLEYIVPGGLGVTIFFVLSGYLITTLMRAEHARFGSINYRGFYLRRLLRLMPPLLFVVGIVWILSALSIVDGGFTLGGLLAALFYFGNYYVISNDFSGMPDGLGVIWSLSIEEHYYLVYPPLAALILRVGRTGLSTVILSTLCLFVLAWRFWLVRNGVSEAYITMATDTRIDAILIGCLMALSVNPWLDNVPAQNTFRDGVIAIAAIAVLVATLLYRDETFRLTVRYSLQSLSIAVLIYLAIARAYSSPFRWLNARPVSYIGTVSYTIYLSHHIIIQAVIKHFPQSGWIAQTLIGIAVTLGVAEMVRRWIEKPIAKLRSRLHRKSQENKTPSVIFSLGPS